MRTMGLGLVAVGLVLGSAAVACSAPPSNKTPLIVCTAGEDGCPSEKPKSPRQTKTASDDVDDEGPSGAPSSAPDADDEDDTLPETPSDAGAPETLGKVCTKLKACCDQLKAAGYSDATCLEIVDTKSENACSLQHKQYRDFGDCT